jgi:CRP-like cAMP-binding protein
VNLKTQRIDTINEERIQNSHKRQPFATLVETKSAGDLFGEYTFFTGLESRYSIRSKGSSQIKYISREVFLELIKGR